MGVRVIMGMRMVAVVVVVMVRMMCIREVTIMRMAMVVVVIVMVIMVMLMVMTVVVVAMLMSLARIFKPEPRHRIPSHTPQPANLLQRAPQRILHVRWQRQQQPLAGAAHKRDRRQEDQHRDDAGRERIPARPAVHLRQNR